MIIIFKPWMEKLGAGDIQQHFQLRGFDIQQHPQRKDLAVVKPIYERKTQ